MSNPLTKVPFAGKKRRKAKAKEGAKFGGPALLAAAAGVVALVLRRKKKSGDQPDVASTQAAQTEAATQDADNAVVESDGGAGADSLGSAPGPVGVAPEGSVTPDVGADDPLVREETNAAASEARAIGSDPDQPA
jgi:hypothetical protein